MTHEEASSLTFSMKEAVKFDRGKGMDELLSLSLEPDIELDGKEDGVTVRGVLHLSGEYKLAEETGGNYGDDTGHMQDMMFRSVDELRVSENGGGEFYHKFPLEITIPRERIDSEEDLGVTVLAFDYETPDRSCLEITAELAVTGVKGDAGQSDSSDKEEEDLTGRSFEFEQYAEENAQTDEEDNEHHYADENDEERDFNSGPEYTFQAGEAVTGQEETEEHTRFADEGNESDGSGFNDYEEEQAHEFDEFEEDSEPEASYNERAESDHAEEEAVEKDTGREGEDESGEGTDNALYLTKMLSGSDEEAYSKLRMCIVQDGESIDTIADRYDMQVTQLMRMNRMKEEHVSEGQILYIPVKPSSLTE